MKNNTKFGTVGGMALIEGVMMKSKNKVSMAVRKNDGIIEISNKESIAWYKKIKIDKIPIVRGCIAFFDSLVSGIKSITESTKMLDISDNDGEKIEITNNEITVSVIIALIIAVGMFLAIPNLIANAIAPLKIVENRLIYNIIETTIKLVIFIIYIVAISNLKDIKRLFMYHGAEHKAVNAYENVENEKLTVKIVKEYSRFHARCGSSFIILVLIISFVISYLILIPNFWIRIRN